jgi:uncharacterized protein YicC (UPF0701 family)
LEGVERGEIAPKEFCPYGFGARTLDRSLQRGLWEGSKLTTELTTRLDIREKVLNDVSAAKSPELILWTAQQRYEIAVERLKEAIAQSDISTTLTDFTAAS